MTFFKQKNIFKLNPVHIFVVGLFFIGGFFVFARSASAELMSCECEETTPGCATVTLTTDEFNASNRDEYARTACDTKEECTATSIFVGVCPGWFGNLYACDNCFQADGSCAIFFANDEANTKEKCWRRVPDCTSLGQANITISTGVCSIKKFIYQGSENAGDCVCREVEAVDLKSAQEVVDDLRPTITSCVNTDPPEVEGIGECPSPDSVGGVYHCFRIDDDVCRDIKASSDQNAQDQAINFCQASAASSPEKPRAERGPCPAVGSGSEIPSGKSAEELQREAARSLNPASINLPTDLIGKAIRLLMAFIGSISLVLYVYAGILWLSAGGASERVDKAKKVIVWTTLGVVVMLASYMLVSFVFKSLGL